MEKMRIVLKALDWCLDGSPFAPVSGHMVAKICKGSMSRATVYRKLKELKHLGFVIETQSENGHCWEIIDAGYDWLDKWREIQWN